MLRVILSLQPLYHGILWKNNKMIDKDIYIRGHYTNKDVCDLIKHLESNLNLKQWNYQTVQLWTVVRNSLASTIANSRIKSNSSSFVMPINKPLYSKHIFSKTFHAVREAWVGIIQILKVALLNFFKNSTVLLVGDGVSKSLVSSKWADKFLDPLRWHYETKNIHTVFLDVNEFPKKPLYSKVFNIDKIEKTAYFFARLYLFLRNINIMDSTEILSLKNNLEKNKIDTGDYTLKNFAIIYYKIIILSFFLRIVLNVLKVKKIYIVAYYNLYGYAFCHAANILNIKVIDIQHGIIENHPAYQFFGDCYSKNNCLPNLFWVWDRRSHELFKKNNISSFLKYHKSFPGGIPWKLWQNKIYQLEQSNQKYFFDSSKIHILVTMQPEIYERKLWQKLIPVIKKNNQYYWWIRKHPAFFDACYQLDELDNVDYKHVNFFEAYRLPIYTLFEHSVLHITTDSSSALDAEIFNVPTIFLSHLCYEFFPHIMAEKKGIYLESIKDIEIYIASLTKTSI